MKRWVVAVASLCLLFASTAVVSAVQVKVLGTHNAKFNLDGTVLGVYRDHTPLIIKNLSTGRHKLYVRSLITGEVQLFDFTAERGDQPEFKASFAPPRDTVNHKARRRTMLVVALGANEILNSKVSKKQDGRKVIGVAGLVNELSAGSRHDRQYSKRFGNTIEVKAQVPLDINVNGEGAQTYEVNEAKRFHHLPAGWNKLFVRNRKTGELKVFKVEFPYEGTRTVTIRPQFAPPRGETVNAKARRRTGILAGLLVNEVTQKKSSKKADGRKVGLGAALINELIPTRRGRVRPEVVLDLTNLPYDLPMSIDDN